MIVNKLDTYSKSVLILNFFNKCNIICNDINNLDGTIIYRDTLLNPDLYNKIKQDIPLLKNILNSSTYTSVQKNAQNNQKWPLINLIRQILKQYHYELNPKRLADGYTKDRQKKYKRLFEIKKKSIEIKDDFLHNSLN